MEVAVKVRNPYAATLRSIKPSVVKPRKGKGSYSRKTRKSLTRKEDY